MKRFKLILTLLLGLFGITNYSFAIKNIDTQDEYTVTGAITAEEYTTEHQRYLRQHPELKQVDLGSDPRAVPPYIKLLKLKPNPYYIPSKFLDDQLTSTKNMFPYNGNFPSRVLWEPTSPVLNQGNFGTCVTFSAIGAIASSHRVTSYQSIPSASCMLQALRSKGQEAWNSYWVKGLAIYLKGLGWISEQKGQSGFCNHTFRTYEPYGEWSQTQAGLTIPVDTYISQSYQEIFYATPPRSACLNYGMPTFPPCFENTLAGMWALDPIGFMKANFNDTNNVFQGYHILNRLPGNYVQFAFFFSNIPSGDFVQLSDGKTYPVWVNHGSVDYSVGHAIYAYGYDDNIVVHGQKGVFFLRNSWGPTNGHGDYLMTYDYFITHVRADDVAVSFLRRAN